MKYRINLITILSIMLASNAWAASSVVDTINRKYELEEVVILSSNKETNDLKTLPTAMSLITPKRINANRINALKDLSTFVPNFYIPDYGSRMTSAVYIRGIGARSSGQTIGMYVDNVPYMDKSTFDFDMMDIQRIEVLRGPQGTLYGRNAMGGLVNVYTKSPLDYQGSTLKLTGGSHGTFKGQYSIYQPLSERLGISAGGFYNRNSGFYTNRYNGRKIDKEENAGGKMRLEYLLSDDWKLNFSTRFDYVEQGAFPYGLYEAESGKTAPVNYNDEGSYDRKTSTNSLAFSHEGEKMLFTSTTAYQYYKDNMWMDQDYSPEAVFTLNQRQKQHSVNEELSLKSNTKSNYQWSVGAFGFYNSLETEAPVTFQKDGIATILQPVFDKIHQNNPKAPVITIKDETSVIPGMFETPTWGVALFHQSTYNNLFVDGLSVTLGLRAEYEKARLNYNTTALMNMTVKPGNMPFAIPVTATDTLLGKLDNDFWQVLPRFSVKYAFTPSKFVYFSVSRGYKTGGYNIQMFSDLVQESMMAKYQNTTGGGNAETARMSVRETVSFDPESSWNYELGARLGLIERKLNLDASLFCITVNDMQLTKFVPSGKGRMIVNAGKATSTGVELAVNGEIVNGLSYYANYGFTHAVFDRYATNVKDEAGNVVEQNYKGNHLPFAPCNTLAAGFSYYYEIDKPFLDMLKADVQYAGAGKIYWTEANDVMQDYYSTLNAKISLVKSAFELSLWGRNLTNTAYNTFYFESRGKGYAQKARPLQWGVDLIVCF